jgi:negative regulator of flagellin synthesis FlgM
MKGITGNPALDAYHRMAISPVGGARSVDRPEATSSKSADSPAAQVSISARARDLASEAAGSGVDGAKVDSIRQRIADGNYQVNPQAIAAKMMNQLG